MKRKFLWHVTGIFLVMAFALAPWAVLAQERKPTPSVQAPPKVVKAAPKVDDLRASYPIMRPDHETLMRWIAAYQSAPQISLDEKGMMLIPLRGSKSLLSHLSYVPALRNQGNCGDCWAWAGTGVMGIDLDVQKGTLDQLSVQYINSCKSGSYACCGGWLSDVADFYTTNPQAIPWSNTNASFADAGRSCASGSSLVGCGSIATSPNYLIDSISDLSITTQGVAQATAIANIKAVLNANKAVFFAFYLADDADWQDFFDYWDAGPETALWDPNPYCGHTWVDLEGGGHAVLCVGYNDDDPNPANHYWIIVNSWGTAGGARPNGIYRMKMDINYSCTFYDGAWYYSLNWQTLDIDWSTNVVLWNQPMSASVNNSYPSQDFETAFDTYDTYTADDFTNTVPWSISTIFVQGDLWNGGTSLMNATSLRFFIYTNSAGVPSGYPDGGLGGSGSPVWSLSVAPADPRVTLTTGVGGYLSNVTLKLTAPINLDPGTYWFGFYPEMSFTSYGQYGRHVSDTTNGYEGKFNNPGGAFGYGTSWTDLTTWTGTTQTDWAFRLEGGIAGAAPCDFDGDGDSDIGVWRPSNGKWYIQGQSAVAWGVSTDIPVPEDYDGDGDSGIAVWRPSDGRWYIEGMSSTPWGVSGDIPQAQNIWILKQTGLIP